MIDLKLAMTELNPTVTEHSSTMIKLNPAMIKLNLAMTELDLVMIELNPAKTKISLTITELNQAIYFNKRASIMDSIIAAHSTQAAGL